MKYLLSPETPGQLGPKTRINSDSHPPVVKSLHYIFDGWLGDELIECFPCYMVTSNLAMKLNVAGVTGFKLAELEVEKSDQFNELYPQRQLPEFKWMQIVGTIGVDDMFISQDYVLAVTPKAFEVIASTHPKDLETECL